MITGPQCRAGRALVEVSRPKLALRSQVAEHVIEQFEHGLKVPDASAIAAIVSALEDLGATFLEENGGGVGVRLRFSRSEAKQISRMEGEGGPAASDVVL